jgi:hypothetical protein
MLTLVYFSVLMLAYFPQVGLCDLHAVCVSPSIKLLNARTNLYETLYVYHGTRAHLMTMTDLQIDMSSFPIRIPPSFVTVITYPLVHRSELQRFVHSEYS